MLQITIRAARVNANLTQEEAAKKLGISRNALIELEKNPEETTYSLAEKMSEMYKVPKDSLIFLSIYSTLSGCKPEERKAIGK